MDAQAAKKALLAAIACMLIVAAPLYAIRGDKYDGISKTFRSRDGRFSITFPNRPQKSTQAVETMDGEIEFISFHADCNGASFRLTYVDFPDKYLAKLDPCNPFLDFGVPELDLFGEAATVERTDIDYHGHHGIRWKVRRLDGSISHRREIFVTNRGYALDVSARQAISDLAQITRFFESFTIDGLQ
jgi:hypothetical protein